MKQYIDWDATEDIENIKNDIREIKYDLQEIKDNFNKLFLCPGVGEKWKKIILEKRRLKKKKNKVFINNYLFNKINLIIIKKLKNYKLKCIF